MSAQLEKLIAEYRELGIAQQIDYDKFYLYSIITHSTAIEGSTITELENQIMFDQGVSLKGKTLIEQSMNLDLKKAYERAIEMATAHTPFSVEMLMELSALVMKNTGCDYHTMLGDFSSARGELRLVNVMAGAGGRSYMSYTKVPVRLKEFCEVVNRERAVWEEKTIDEQYDFTFDAHYDLVTIHPWADGNGRMARLVMNLLQFEFGLIPSKVLTEDKEEYIKALVETREKGDLTCFRNFMRKTMVRNLTDDIKIYQQTVEEDGAIYVSGKTRDKILTLLSQNNKMSAKLLAEELGISVKGVEKQLAKLKSEGALLRIGPAKGGHWQVLD